jgi:hypothetical protein
MLPIIPQDLLADEVDNTLSSDSSLRCWPWRDINPVGQICRTFVHEPASLVDHAPGTLFIGSSTTSHAATRAKRIVTQ